MYELDYFSLIDRGPASSGGALQVRVGSLSMSHPRLLPAEGGTTNVLRMWVRMILL
jgi:hypothetical protein